MAGQAKILPAMKQVLVNPVFGEAIRSPKRYKRFQGGAGSGKSIAVAKIILWRMMQTPGQRAFCFRKIRARVRDSLWQTFLDLLSEYEMAGAWEKNISAFTLTFRGNGSMIVCGGLDDQEKIKSIKDPTIIWMEEATEFTEMDFTQLDLRLRKPGALLEFFFSYNPISKNNWVYNTFETRRALAGKEVFISTTYHDNPYLPGDYRRMLESLASRSPEHHKVYTLGHWGEITQGLIFTDYEIVEEWPGGDTIYGLDFGFNDPMALVEVAIRPEAFYVRELLYESGRTVPELVQLLPGLGVGFTDLIYADSASPGNIQIIYNGRGGARFRGVKPSQKGADSIVAGINLLKSRPLRILSDSRNLLYELDRYSWEIDKDGKKVEGKPADAFNHAIDATRYAVFTHLFKGQARGYQRGRSIKAKQKYRR
jgi:phage terminase large subunit